MKRHICRIECTKLCRDSCASHCGAPPTSTTAGWFSSNHYTNLVSFRSSRSAVAQAPLAETQSPPSAVITTAGPAVTQPPPTVRTLQPLPPQTVVQFPTTQGTRPPSRSRSRLPIFHTHQSVVAAGLDVVTPTALHRVMPFVLKVDKPKLSAHNPLQYNTAPPISCSPSSPVTIPPSFLIQIFFIDPHRRIVWIEVFILLSHVPVVDPHRWKVRLEEFHDSISKRPFSHLQICKKPSRVTLIVIVVYRDSHPGQTIHERQSGTFRNPGSEASSSPLPHSVDPRSERQRYGSRSPSTRFTPRYVLTRVQGRRDEPLEAVVRRRDRSPIIMSMGHEDEQPQTWGKSRGAQHRHGLLLEVGLI